MRLSWSYVENHQLFLLCFSWLASSMGDFGQVSCNILQQAHSVVAQVLVMLEMKRVHQKFIYFINIERVSRELLSRTHCPRRDPHLVPASP